MFVNKIDEAFNITLEILKDCGYNCVDCAIDKTKTSDFIRVGDDDRLIRLADEMKDRGLRLHEFTIGPTDLISSKSGLDILDQWVVRELAQRYDSITVSLALLFDRGLVELAERISRLMKGKKFRLIVPTTLKNSQNPKFMDMIRERIKIIHDHLVDVEFKVVYFTVNVINDGARLFEFKTNKMMQDLDLGVEKIIEYPFPHSRLGLKVMKEEFLDDFHQFVRGIHDSVDTEYNRYLVPDITDSLEAVYHRGELYYVPTLIEKFPIFEPQFVLPRPWTMDSILQYKEDLYLQNLEEYSYKSPCDDCCFVDHCARGDVHTIMRHLDFEKCLIDMKNRWDLHPEKV